jgi:predicted DNA-binding transcriptional regulator AlpA
MVIPPSKAKYTVREVAALTGLSEDTIYRRVKLPADHSGHIHSRHISERAIRLPAAEVDRLRGVTPAALVLVVTYPLLPVTVVRQAALAGGFRP